MTDLIAALNISTIKHAYAHKGIKNIDIECSVYDDGGGIDSMMTNELGGSSYPICSKNVVTKLDADGFNLDAQNIKFRTTTMYFLATEVAQELAEKSGLPAKTYSENCTIKYKINIPLEGEIRLTSNEHQSEIDIDSLLELSINGDDDVRDAFIDAGVDESNLTDKHVQFFNMASEIDYARSKTMVDEVEIICASDGEIEYHFPEVPGADRVRELLGRHADKLKDLAIELFNAKTLTQVEGESPSVSKGFDLQISNGSLILNQHTATHEILNSTDNDFSHALIAEPDDAQYYKVDNGYFLSTKGNTTIADVMENGRLIAIKSMADAMLKDEFGNFVIANAGTIIYLNDDFSATVNNVNNFDLSPSNVIDLSGVYNAAMEIKSLYLQENKTFAEYQPYTEILDAFGNSPIHYLASHKVVGSFWNEPHANDVLSENPESIFSFLADIGADLNIGNKLGITPLMVSVVNGNARGVEALLDAGADLLMTNNDGLNAIDLAAKHAPENDGIQALLNEAYLNKSLRAMKP